MNEFLWGINGVDLVLFGLLARAVYIGAVQGVVVEFFKITGLLLAMFITAHYFSRLAGFLTTWLKIFSREQADVFFIAALWILVMAVFSLVRSGWLVILKAEEPSRLSRCSGWVVGALRGVLICGMVIFMVLVSGQMALIKNVRKALLGRYVADLVFHVYETGYEEGIRRIFPEELKNKEMRRYRLAEFFKSR